MKYFLFSAILLAAMMTIGCKAPSQGNMKEALTTPGNPFLPLRDRPDFETYALDVLKMMIADCAASFERLPILTDAPLIRNILYSGVWSGYGTARRLRAKKEDGK